MRGEFMKKFLLAGAAFGALIGPAVGADVLEPVYRAPATFAWTGWYVGVNAGYTFNSQNVQTVSLRQFAATAAGADPLSNAITNLGNSTIPITNDGFIGGAQFGYNWQVAWLATSLVAGFEADIQGVSGKGSSSFESSVQAALLPPPPPPQRPPPQPLLTQTAAATSSVDYLGTLRARLGMLVGFLGTTVLYYATGGLAYGGVSANTTVSQTLGAANTPPGFVTARTWSGTGSMSGMRVGWAAGVGMEWLFLPNWSTSFEYLHYDLGTPVYSLTPMVSNAPLVRPFTVNNLTAATPFSGEILRIGVNYHL
jgi:outer membrane immunogenic protein